MSKKLTMSKYCRISSINIIKVSKELGIPLKELNIIYSTDQDLFEKIIFQSWKSPGLLTFYLISKMFNISIKRIQTWRLRGLNAYFVSGATYAKNHLRYPEICEFISSGRA